MIGSRSFSDLNQTAAVLLVVLTWSACFVVIKASQADAPPLLYAALRAVIGGIPLLAVAAGTGRLLPPPRTWGWIALLGLTNTTLGLAGMFLSVRGAGATIPAILANSQALIVAPLAALLFHETLTIKRSFGVILGTIGVALTMSVGTGGSWRTEGAAMGLMAALGLAVGSLVIKHLGSRVHALTATAWQYALGALPLLGMSLALETGETLVWTPKFAAGLVFLGIIGSAGASWGWFRLVSRGELIHLNGLTLLTPVFAVALAFLIYREPLSARQLLGIGVTLLGVIWVGRPDRSPLKLATPDVAVRARARTPATSAHGGRRTRDVRRTIEPV
ncbi:MAG: DMT family transporter [Nitrospinota bacterium]